MSSDIVVNSEPVRGLAFFGASSGSTSVTYGPYRPAFATTGSPLSGCGAELAVAARRGQQLLGLLDGQLVGRDVLGHRRALRDSSPSGPRSTYGPVPADPQHDVVADRDRVDLAGVDVAEVLDTSVVQTRAELVAAVAEVEAAQPVDPVCSPLAIRSRSSSISAVKS